MSLWDELPEPVRSTGALDGLRPLLDGLTGSGPVETSDADGFWSTYTATEDLTGPLALDPRTGAFTSGGSGGGSGTPIEFADPHVVVTLSFHLTGTGGSRDGGWKVELTAPSLRIRMPFLRGAMLDSFGHLRADTSKPTVAFTLPAVKVRVRQLAGAAVSVDLMSATIGPGRPRNPMPGWGRSYATTRRCPICRATSSSRHPGCSSSASASRSATPMSPPGS